MKKVVCDICGVDEPKHNWKIKERSLYYGGDKVPIIRWDRLDICDRCFENLVNLRYEQDLEKRLMKISDKYEKKYPHDIDMQSAYLTGISDALNVLLQNKVIKK